MNLTNVIKSLQVVGIFVALISAGTISITLMFKGKIPQERERLMKGLVNLCIGLFLLGSISSIVGFLLSTQNNLSSSIKPGGKGDFTYDDPLKESKEKSSFGLRVLAEPLDAFTSVILGEEGSNGLMGLGGFESLDNLIYKPKNEGKTVPPFTKEEWNAISGLYYMLLGLTGPLMVLMVGRSIILYIKNASEPQKLVEVKEDMKRWGFCLLLSAGGLLLCQAVFEFAAYLSTILYARCDALGIVGEKTFWGSVSTTGIVSTIKTGNIFTTAIVKFMMAALTFKVNVSFMARKWVLIIMTGSTPLIAALWGINKKVQAFDVWMGEIVTNAAMALAYGITFAGLSLVLRGKQNFVFIIIGMSMAIKLADVLRNLLQGLFTRMAGVDELNEGLGGLTQAGTILSGAFGVFSASGIKNPSRSTFSQAAANTFKNLTGKGGKDSGDGAGGLGESGSRSTSSSSTARTIGGTGGPTTGETLDGMNDLKDNPMQPGSGSESLTDALNELFPPDSSVGSAPEDLSDDSVPMFESSSNVPEDLSDAPGDLDHTMPIPRVTDDMLGNAEVASDSMTASSAAGTTATTSSNPDVAAKQAAAAKKKHLSELQTRDNKNLSRLSANYKKLVGDKNDRTKQIGNRMAFGMTGGDRSLSGFGTGVATAISSSLNGLNMARALWQTSGEIAMEEKTAKGEVRYTENGQPEKGPSMKERGKALTQMFGKYSYDKENNGASGYGKEMNKKNAAYTTFQSARIVGSSLKNNPEKTERVLMKNHIGSAYNKNMGFDGWSDL